MSRETAVAKRFNMEDADLPWTYARTEETGSIFGLKVPGLMTVFRPELSSICYAPHTYRILEKIVHQPEPVEYVESPGDGSSHGATWRNFARLLEPLDLRNFAAVRSDDTALELHLDGLQNMALEGANRHGEGWATIHKGLVGTREDLYDGKGYMQGPLFQGLGWLATNFAEREEATVKILTT